MLFTIDPYYNTIFYNESLEALKNNKVQFEELITIKTPYNWVLKTDQLPIMINYDEVSNNDKRYLVTKVIALRENEEYLLQRRNDDTGEGISKYIENQPFAEARKSDYSVLFNISNKEELIRISKEFPDKIWYLGRYFNNVYNVCLCNNKMIKNYLKQSQILLEKQPEHKLPGSFEADFNFKVLKMKDRIKKFTETTFIQNGLITMPKISKDKTKTIVH